MNKTNEIFWTEKKSHFLVLMDSLFFERKKKSY
jgi:hypothetical protein